MNLDLIKTLCRCDKEHLKTILTKFLFSKGYKKVFRTNDYIYVEGTLPICLIAHMDTVFKHQLDPEDFFYDGEKHLLWYPYGAGFDDRAGIYAIIQILERGYRPSVIFTDGEEKGGIGAQALIKDRPKCPFKKCNALIQLDRANFEDSVFYSCDNRKFEKYINNFGFITDWGTFTDISIIAPQWGIAAVNLSIGYVDEHTSCERLYCDWCDATIEKVMNILDASLDMKYYKYVPFKTPKFYFNNCIVCNKKVGIDDSHLIKDPSYVNYRVCNECYDRYYLAT